MTATSEIQLMIVDVDLERDDVITKTWRISPANARMLARQLGRPLNESIVPVAAAQAAHDAATAEGGVVVVDGEAGQ
jgi:hypothetical protein